MTLEEKFSEICKLLNLSERYPLDSRLADSAESLSMRAKQLTVEQVLEIMRKRQGDRTQREFAPELGITPQYLCDLYLRRREPGETVLKSLGLIRRTIYEQVT